MEWLAILRKIDPETMSLASGCSPFEYVACGVVAAFRDVCLVWFVITTEQNNEKEMIQIK